MKDWTIMVYMAGDNDLNQETIDAIKGIKYTNVGGKGEEANVAWLVYFDPSATSYPTAYIDLTNDDGNGPYIQAPFGSSLGDGEESTEESIHRFILWCVSKEGTRRFREQRRPPRSIHGGRSVRQW